MKVEKGINLAIYELRNKIATELNNCKLPISVARQIIKEINGELEVMEQEQIKKEMQEYNERLKESSSKEEKEEGNIQ